MTFVYKDGEHFCPWWAAAVSSGLSALGRPIMTKNLGHQLAPDEISDFVVDVIGAGCDIRAVGHDKYVIGDIGEQDAALEELDRISEKYGNRSPLKLEIVAYLRSIGRYMEIVSEPPRN